MDAPALAPIRATLLAERASQVFAQQRDLALRDRADGQLVLVE